MSTRALSIYGPIQFPDRLGIELFQFERAVRLGLIPAADLPGGRWSAGLFEAARERREEILARVGDQPDLGAARSAGALQERLGRPVSPRLDDGNPPGGYIVELPSTILEWLRCAWVELPKLPRLSG